MTFEEFGLAQPIIRAVAAEGYSAPTPIQSRAIPPLLAGKDLLGCAQTGTGKTAAFALPLLHRLVQTTRPRSGRAPIRALVLAPTRELAVQINESLRSYGRYTGLRTAVIFGGVSSSRQIRDLRQGIDIVVATPGRLLDLMKQGFVALGTVESFVLDEADRMMDMGFLPSLRRIVAHLPKSRQTMLFSATMPEPMARLASAILNQPIRVDIVSAKAELPIEQSVCFVARQEKSRFVADLLLRPTVTRALVFTRTKRGADSLTRQLNQSGICAEAMHSNKSQSARQRTLAKFRSCRTPVLVATDIAARGIDVDGVSHVVNFDLPDDPETYVHRIGRTGRAGVPGTAVSLCAHDERQMLQAIERLIRQRLRVDQGSQARAPARGQQPTPDQQRSAIEQVRYHRQAATPSGRPQRRGQRSSSRLPQR